jgi:formylglycine-generating enzyme required for sulfatase activity
MNRKPWFLAVGMLFACLTITGCKNEPTADFSADVTSGRMPLTVQFTDLSTPGASPITGWHWIFGDGEESTVQNPSHVYTWDDTFNVSLEITTAAGNHTELKLNFITVTPPDAGTVETVMLPGDVPLEMLWIPAGAFAMGSPDYEQDRSANEGPRHDVTFVSGFWMAKYELTKRQWLAVMGTLPWAGQPFIQVYPESPAVYVSWNDAQDFVGAINVLTDKNFRLPAEAEWEYACRAGETARFYYGDDPSYAYLGNHAWWDGNANSAGQQYAHVVGLKEPNAWGLYDMAGNVWELCEDDWHGNYTGAPAYGYAWVDEPRGPNRVARGGSWVIQGAAARSATRSSNTLDYAHSSIGFRLVSQVPIRRLAR